MGPVNVKTKSLNHRSVYFFWEMLTMNKLKLGRSNERHLIRGMV